MKFHSHTNVSHFHVNGCAPGLALMERLKATRKFHYLAYWKPRNFTFLLQLFFLLIVLKQLDPALINILKHNYIFIIHYLLRIISFKTNLASSGNKIFHNALRKR